MATMTHELAAYFAAEEAFERAKARHQRAWERQQAQPTLYGASSLRAMQDEMYAAADRADAAWEALTDEQQEALTTRL